MARGSSSPRFSSSSWMRDLTYAGSRLATGALVRPSTPGPGGPPAMRCPRVEPGHQPHTGGVRSGGPTMPCSSVAPRPPPPAPRPPPPAPRPPPPPSPATFPACPTPSAKRHGGTRTREQKRVPGAFPAPAPPPHLFPWGCAATWGSRAAPQPPQGASGATRRTAAAGTAAPRPPRLPRPRTPPTTGGTAAARRPLRHPRWGACPASRRCRARWAASAGHRCPRTAPRRHPGTGGAHARHRPCPRPQTRCTRSCGGRAGGQTRAGCPALV